MWKKYSFKLLCQLIGIANFLNYKEIVRILLFSPLYGTQNQFPISVNSLHQNSLTYHHKKLQGFVENVSRNSTKLCYISKISLFLFLY